jgi:predicted 2-oxoglutarate/Fe(II)-dependent dioxygenase YbiX/peroxiredoxin
MNDSSQARIFVQIASYRDPECHHTIRDLFEKASHPERIFVGVCWQYDPVEDAAYLAVPYPREDQVRVARFHHQDAKGAGWARMQAQNLWDGEEYTLQIQAHMRFEQGWDSTLIDMLARCPSHKPAISTYLPRYMPPDNKQVLNGECLRVKVHGVAEEGDAQMLHLTKTVVPLSDTQRSGLYPCPFWVGNFLFAPSQLLQEVPSDPYIYFLGEELAYSARLYTHGWDIFQPDKTVLYHFWRRDEEESNTAFKKAEQGNKRSPKAVEGNRRSLARVRGLLGFANTTDADALADIRTYGLGSARPLAAFWNFIDIDIPAKRVSARAKQGIWNLERPSENMPPADTIATQIQTVLELPALPEEKTPRIFINIASYRDPECQWTVKDLFEKANNPDRIFVGICWQFDEAEDAHCFEVSTRPDQVRIHPVDWRDAEGVCWARLMTQKLWDGEEYTLMIDSHMRFVPGWDDLLIAELAKCASAKPVLSCSPASYVPPDKLSPNLKPSVRRVKQFMDNGNIRCQGELLDVSPPAPLKGAFLVANFVFSRSEILQEVPYDPYLYFDQEEITYAARLYTHGWDIYHPTRQFLYHFYNDKKIEGIKERNLHWDDLHKEDQPRIRFLRERGYKRFNHLTGYHASNDPEVTKECNIYGWGTVRSLAQFEAYCGVDFRNKVATEKALQCQFIENLRKYRKSLFNLPEMQGKPAPVISAAHSASPLKQAGPAPLRQVIQPPSAVMLSTPGSTRDTKLDPRGDAPTYRPPMSTLEVGDFVLDAELESTDGHKKALETFGGKHTLLYYLPVDDLDYLRIFFEQFNQTDAPQNTDLNKCFVLNAPIQKLMEIKSTLGMRQNLLADPRHRFANSLGIWIQERIRPSAFILCPNLRVLGKRINISAYDMVHLPLDDAKHAINAYEEKNRSPRIITELPPAMIINNVFTPEQCAHYIDVFRNGEQVEGTVGADRQYHPNVKSRTDHMVYGNANYDIDAKLARSVFPEIRKVFGFDVSHRESYKVGRYSAEKGGFFKGHRDNYELALGYRRVAMTVNLNDDYEGGGVIFPEYGRDVYRPPAGGALVFPCAVLHEAIKITKGERFALICFFHGQTDEAFRRQVHSNQEKPLAISQFTPVLRKFPNIPQSRSFYRKWENESIDYQISDVGTPPKAKD